MILLGCLEIKLLTKKRRVLDAAKIDKVKAVKLYRELYNAPLKTALETVNKWIGNNP